VRHSRQRRTSSHTQQQKQHAKAPETSHGPSTINPQPSTINPQPSTTNDQRPTIVLEVERLSYRYPGGQMALRDVSFALAAGEIVGLVGPSGAGKSTLLMHLNGLLGDLDRANANGREPAAPAVRIAGLPMTQGHLAEIRRLVGFLFQDPDDQLFCPTVREDVAFGPLNLGLPGDEVRQRVVESLQAVGLEDYEFRSTLQLSVGERKRVCLAGVLACRPALLALDEPFTNLDPRARRTLLEILRAFSGSQILATHDLDMVVELCSRVIVLDEGSVQADGSTDVILSDARLMERHGLEVPWRLQR
jgi:energy-coupling factor transporter ATP-binding protein EcfA2